MHQSYLTFVRDAVPPLTLLFLNLVGTIFEATSTHRKNENRSERHENSDDSNSICSFTHSSCDSMSEASYELTPWHGKLSMSWESIGPDAMSSSVFLAPQATC